MQTHIPNSDHYSGAIVRDRPLELARAMINLGDIATRENIKSELGWTDEEIDYHKSEAIKIASRAATRRIA